MRTLVIGLGNPILTDDSVGIHCVRQLKQSLAAFPDIDTIESSVGGITLMEHMVGYQRVVLIDALWTPPDQVGQVIVFDAGDLTGTANTRSTHDTDLSTALQAGRSLRADLPDDRNIQIVAITANELLSFAETPTASVRAAIPDACRVVLHLLGVTPDEDSNSTLPQL